MGCTCSSSSESEDDKQYNNTIHINNTGKPNKSNNQQEVKNAADDQKSELNRLLEDSDPQAYVYTDSNSKYRIRIEYQMFNSLSVNTPILLIIGRSRVKEDFHYKFVLDLAQYMNSPVVIFDNRGLGGSYYDYVDKYNENNIHIEYGDNRQYTISDLAIDSVNLMQSLFGKSKKFHIIGFSLGGTIAQQICILYGNSNIIDSVIIAGSSTINHESKLPTEYLDGKPFLFGRELYYAWAKHALTKEWINNNKEEFEELFEVEMKQFRCDQAIIDQYTSTDKIEKDFGPQLDTSKYRVLVLHGELDTVTPYTEGEKIHKMIPGSDFIVIPRQGHNMYIMQDESIVPIITKWLQKT